MSLFDGSGAAPTTPHRHVTPYEEVGIVNPRSSVSPRSTMVPGVERSSSVVPVPVSSTMAPT
jgi:hypothetical protein